jgi:predicted RNase H-like HicB family nuclease
MKRYAIVLENAGPNWGAYVPDLPGCVATGATRAETEAAIREAIQFHLEGMAEDNEPVPEPTCEVDYVEVAV